MRGVSARGGWAMGCVLATLLSGVLGACTGTTTLTSPGSFSIPLPDTTTGLPQVTNCTYILDAGVGKVNQVAYTNLYCDDYYYADRFYMFDGTNTAAAPLSLQITNYYFNYGTYTSTSRYMTLVVTQMPGRRVYNRNINVAWSAVSNSGSAFCANNSVTNINAQSSTYISNQLAASSFNGNLIGPRNWVCSFLITANPGYRVAMQPNNFNLGPGDSVSFTDLGATVNTTLTMTYEESISNQLGPFYYWGASNRGYLVTYTAGSAPAPNAAGFRYYAFAQNNLAPLCSGVYAAQTGSSGYISNQIGSSGTYQCYLRYLPSTYCAFAVNVTAGQRITFSAQNTQMGPFADYVTYYDGDSPAAPRISAVTSSGGYTFTTTSNRAYIVFQTNDNPYDDGNYWNCWGFSATWTAVAGTTTPTLPRPAYDNQCSGNVTLNTNYFLVGNPAGTAPGYNVGLNCGFIYKSPVGVHGYKVYFSGYMNYNDRIEMYEGDSTNPIIDESSMVDYGNILAYSSGYYYSYMPGIGNVRTYFLVGDLLYFHVRTDGQQDGDGAGVKVFIMPDDQYTTCTPYDNAVPSSGQYFGYPNLYSYRYRYSPNTFCTWHVAPGSPFTLQLNILDIRQGDLLSIYAGNSTSGALIWTSNNYYSSQFYLPNAEAFVVFQSGPPPAYVTNGRGFSMYYQTVTPTTYSCDRGQSSVPFSFSTVVVGFPDQANQPYSGQHDCRWLYTAQPGTQLSMYFNTISLFPGDYVIVYDGPNTSSPIVGQFAALSSGYNLPYLPTQCNILIRMQAYGNSILPMFTNYYFRGFQLQLTASQSLPSSGLCPLPAQTTCSGGNVDSLSDVTALHLDTCVWLTGSVLISGNFQGVFTMPLLKIITTAGQILTNYNFYSGAQAMSLYLPLLDTVAGTIQISGGYLGFFQMPVVKFIANFRMSNMYSWGGTSPNSLQLQFPLLKSVGNLQFTYLYSVPNITMSALQNADTFQIQYCQTALTSINVGSLQTCRNCYFYGNNVWVTANFSSLQHVGSWTQQQNALPVNDFPRLTIIDSQFSFGSAQATSLRLPSLVFANCIYLQSSNLLTTVDFSTLTSVYQFNVQSVGLTALPLPCLSFVNSFQMSSLTTLTSIAVPVLRNANIYLSSVSALVTLSLPAMTNGDLHMQTGNTQLQTVAAPNLHQSTICVETGNPKYADINFPGLLTVTTLSVSSLDVLTINMPLVANIDTLDISTSRIQTLSFPSLKLARCFSIQQSIFISRLNLPQLATVSSTMLLADTTATSISLPALRTVGGTLTLRSNYQLEAFYVCQLTQTSGVFVSSPKLSCYETSLMFAGAALTMGDGDCDASVRGTFGCASNFTRLVNTTQCGFTVDCIQQAIEGAYSNSSVSVLVPAGTYYNCTAPLSLLGRVLVLRGEGMGMTVIDCQGFGTAFQATSSETSGAVIQDISFINGNNEADGGAFTIMDASPTFTRVEFAGSRTCGFGGAGNIIGGRPTFVDCVFHGNSAGNSGGSLYITGGAKPVIKGCQVTGSTAASTGGGLAFEGSASAIVLNNVVVNGNTAPRGAGIYVDVAMTINGGEVSNNAASQFGGGIAAVPTVLIGVTLTMTNVTLHNNSAAGDGAGIFLYSCSLTMTSTTLDSNTALTSGGAISAACSESWRKLNGITGTCPVYINVTGGAMTGNTVRQGTGGAVSSLEVYVTINGVMLTNNYASTNGGAIYAGQSQLRVRSSSIMGNMANVFGGGVYCTALGTCETSNSQMHDNYATAAGGAVFFCLSSCLGTTAQIFPDLTATTFAGNLVGAFGYGNTTATDPAALTWLVAPDAEIISGETFVGNSTDHALRLLILDNYGSTVSSSINVLQLVVTTTTGQEVTGVSLAGPTTVLAGSGQGVFIATTPVAADFINTDLTYRLTCQHASIAAVTVSADFKLLPCALGQGVPATRAGTGLYCVDCAAGEFSGPDTNFTCTQCNPGSSQPMPRSANCSLCGLDTFQPAPGSLVCITCPDRSHALEGATVCVREPDSATIVNNNVSGITGTPTVYGILAGVVVCLFITFIVIGCCVYRRTRRKTMEKYYLDEDATVRRGVSESALGLAVRKLIGATTTTRIGGGEFTDVYKGKYNDQWVAVKVLKGEMVGHGIAQSEFRREVTALTLLGIHKHPGIIELKFFLERSPVCIGLEFCPNGSLKRSLKGMQLNVWDKVKMAAQTASALTLLHNYNIIHMDLKTDNILLGENNTIKLADFGICKVLGQDSAPQVRQDSAGGLYASNPVFAGSQKLDSTTVNGALASQYASVIDPFADMEEAAFTPQYCDPYRLVHENDMSELTLKRADVFTFAMVMWAIYSQDEPFAGIDAVQLMEQRRQDHSLRPPRIDDCHKCYDRIMNKAWVTDPAVRPTIHECFAELRECLRNHFGADVAPEYQNVGEQQPLQKSGSSSTENMASMGSFNSSMQPQSMFDMSMNPMNSRRLSMAMPSSQFGMPPMGMGSDVPIANFILPNPAAAQNANAGGGNSGPHSETLQTTMGGVGAAHQQQGSTDSMDSVQNAQSLVNSFKLPPPPVLTGAAPPLPSNLPPNLPPAPALPLGAPPLPAMPPPAKGDKQLESMGFGDYTSVDPSNDEELFAPSIAIPKKPKKPKG